MNVINKATLQGLKKNRTRTIVTIIGVVLSAAMITAVTVFMSSLRDYLIRDEIERSGSWHVSLNPVGADVFNAVKNDKDVKSAALFQTVGFGGFEGGWEVGDEWNPESPYLYIAGLSNEAYNVLPLKLLEGRYPQNTSEILVPKRTKSKDGSFFKIGDKVTLGVGAFHFSEGNNTLIIEKTVNYTVVGICNEDWLPLGYVYTKAEPIEKGAGNYEVYVNLKNPKHAFDFAERYSQTYELSVNRNIDYLRYLGVSDNDNINTTLYGLGGIFIALIMTGSVLFINNAFHISISERTREFGLLKSVGATKEQIRASVLFEGFFIGAIGIPIGILSGILGIGVAIGIAGNLIKEMQGNSDVTLRLFVSWYSVAAAAFIDIATIYISAYIPSVRASRVSAIDSIRLTRDVKIKRREVKTSRVTQKLFGAEGMLASKNFKRDGKRYRATIISLFISVVLFVSANTFTEQLKKASLTAVDTTAYDLKLTAKNLTYDELLSLYNELRNAEGSNGSGIIANSTHYITVPKDALTPRALKEHDNGNGGDETELVFFMKYIDDENYAEYLKKLGLPESEYAGDARKFAAVPYETYYNGDEKRVVSYELFKDKKGFSGKASGKILYNEEDGYMGMEYADINLTFTDIQPEIFKTSYLYGVTVYAPFSASGQFGDDFFGHYDLVFKTGDPDKAEEELKKIADGANADYYIINYAKEQRNRRNMLLIVDIFAYGFIILMSLITSANVFNTISTNVSLRRREFAILKSSGMTSGGINRMMVYECLLYGVKSLLFGLPASLLVSFGIYTALKESVDVKYIPPFAGIGIAVLSVFLVVFATMLYAVGKVKKENVVEAIRMID